MRSSIAGMAELADALALGASGRKAVQARPLFPAPPRRCECNGDVSPTIQPLYSFGGINEPC